MSTLPRPSSSSLVRAAPVFAAALAGLILVPVFLLRVSMRVESVRLGYALSDSASRLNALHAEHQKLRLELETLRAPDRLARLAANDLGLHPPTPERFWRVAVDGSITVADLLPEPPPTGPRGKGGKAKPPAAPPEVEKHAGPEPAAGAGAGAGTGPRLEADPAGETKAMPPAPKPEDPAPKPEDPAPKPEDPAPKPEEEAP